MGLRILFAISSNAVSIAKLKAIVIGVNSGTVGEGEGCEE
jgi:hypothetical protein